MAVAMRSSRQEGMVFASYEELREWRKRKEEEVLRVLGLNPEQLDEDDPIRAHVQSLLLRTRLRQQHEEHTQKVLPFPVEETQVGREREEVRENQKEERDELMQMVEGVDPTQDPYAHTVASMAISTGIFTRMLKFAIEMLQKILKKHEERRAERMIERLEEQLEHARKAVLSLNRQSEKLRKQLEKIEKAKEKYASIMQDNAQKIEMLRSYVESRKRKPGAGPMPA